MAIWHAFLPFGLTIAICVFVSWQATENQNVLRVEGSSSSPSAADDGGDVRRSRGRGMRRKEGLLGDDYPPHLLGGGRDVRPPRTASELRARLSTLSRLAPGPRRLARGRALALAADSALREASPPLSTDDGDDDDDDDGDGNDDGNDDNEIGDGGSGERGKRQREESRAAAAIRATLPWLDARLAALAAEDEAAIKLGLCEICAGHDDACATHAWPCGEVRGGNQTTTATTDAGSLFASLFPFAAAASSSSSSPSMEAFSSSKHRACARCSARCGSRCPWCRREGKAVLSLAVG